MTSTARRKLHSTPTQSHPLSLHPQPDSLGDAGTIRASSDHWRIAALWWLYEELWGKSGRVFV